MNKKVYVFDLDGTVVDSLQSVKELTYGFHADWKITPPDDILQRVLPLGYPGTAEYYVREYRLQETPQEIEEYLINNITRRYEESIPAKGDADEVLRALKARGETVCLLTASPHRFVDPCLKRLGWEHLFDHTWSVEEFSKTKEDPTLFTDVAKALGERSEHCCMVDDSVCSLRSAKAAGWQTVGIYDEISNGDRIEEMKEVADRFVYRLKEIL